MTIVPIRFPDDLYEQLQLLSHVRKQPMANIVREALREKIAKQPEQIKKRMKYRNPLVEMAKRIHKLPPAKDHYPHLSDDELLYEQSR